MFGIKFSLPKLDKKIIYESDDKATYIPNSKLRKMSPKELREEFHELVERINKLCETP